MENLVFHWHIILRSATRILLWKELKMGNFCDVIKMTSYFWSFTISQSIFKTVNWPNHATSDHWELSDFLSCFLTLTGKGRGLQPP